MKKNTNKGFNINQLHVDKRRENEKKEIQPAEIISGKMSVKKAESPSTPRKMNLKSTMFNSPLPLKPAVELNISDDEEIFEIKYSANSCNEDIKPGSFKEASTSGIPTDDWSEEEKLHLRGLCYETDDYKKKLGRITEIATPSSKKLVDNDEDVFGLDTTESVKVEGFKLDVIDLCDSTTSLEDNLKAGTKPNKKKGRIVSSRFMDVYNKVNSRVADKDLPLKVGTGTSLQRSSSTKSTLAASNYNKDRLVRPRKFSQNVQPVTTFSEHRPIIADRAFKQPKDNLIRAIKNINNNNNNNNYKNSSTFNSIPDYSSSYLNSATNVSSQLTKLDSNDSKVKGRLSQADSRKDSPKPTSVVIGRASTNTNISLNRFNNGRKGGYESLNDEGKQLESNSSIINSIKRELNIKNKDVSNNEESNNTTFENRGDRRTEGKQLENNNSISNSIKRELSIKNRDVMSITTTSNNKESNNTTFENRVDRRTDRKQGVGNEDGLRSRRTPDILKGGKGVKRETSCDKAGKSGWTNGITRTKEISAVKKVEINWNDDDYFKYRTRTGSSVENMKINKNNFRTRVLSNEAVASDSYFNVKREIKRENGGGNEGEKVNEGGNVNENFYDNSRRSNERSNWKSKWPSYEKKEESIEKKDFKVCENGSYISENDSFFGICPVKIRMTLKNEGAGSAGACVYSTPMLPQDVQNYSVTELQTNLNCFNDVSAINYSMMSQQQDNCNRDDDQVPKRTSAKEKPVKEKKEKLTQISLVCLYNRYLQLLFIGKKCEVQFKKEEEKAMEQLYYVWDQTKQAKAKKFELEREYLGLKRINDLHNSLIFQENLLTSFLGLLPEAVRLHHKLSDSLDTTRHYIPTSGIYFPPGKERPQYIDDFAASLQESQNLLNELNQLRSAKMPNIEILASQVEALRLNMKKSEEAMEKSSSVLSQAANLLVEDNFLKIQNHLLKD